MTTLPESLPVSNAMGTMLYNTAKYVETLAADNKLVQVVKTECIVQFKAELAKRGFIQFEMVDFGLNWCDELRFNVVTEEFGEEELNIEYKELP